jgi:outer membrane immunogenic protein
MNKYLIAASAIVATGFVSSARAADMPIKAPAYKAPVAVAPYNWTGFYVGAQLGWQRNRGHWEGGTPGVTFFGPSDYSGDGMVGGVHGGYNWQFGMFVLGAEADIEAAHVRTDSVLGFEGRSTMNWQGSVRARAGVAIDRVLFYATGGVSFANFKDTLDTTPVTSTAEFITTRTTGTFGGGVEFAFAKNWTARAEYRYANYGQAIGSATPIFIPGVEQRHSIRSDAVRAAVSFKFD